MDANLPNWQQVTPLHHMASRGEVEAAQLFLAFGADHGAIDEEYHSTPLGWAARSGQAEFVRFALASGFAADGPQSPAWAQPLAWAERRGHEEVAALLRERLQAARHGTQCRAPGARGQRATKKDPSRRGA